jgi:hypothetical protein
MHMFFCRSIIIYEATDLDLTPIRRKSGVRCLNLAIPDLLSTIYWKILCKFSWHAC